MAGNKDATETIAANSGETQVIIETIMIICMDMLVVGAMPGLIVDI